MNAYIPIGSKRILHAMPLETGQARTTSGATLMIFETVLGILRIGVFVIYDKGRWSSYSTTRFHLRPGTYQIGSEETMTRINVTRDEFHGLVFHVERKLGDEFKEIRLTNGSISIIHQLKIKKLRKENEERI